MSMARHRTENPSNAGTRAIIASYCWEDQLASAPATSNNTDVLRLPLNNRSPLGISLALSDSAAQQLLYGPFDSRHLIEGLVREMQFRAVHSKNRPVSLLNWRLPHNLLDNAEVTELMYHLGRQYRLGDQLPYQYQVRFEPQEINPERIALFKGLGFNSIEIYLSHSESLEQSHIQSLQSLSEDFHFDDFSVTLNTPDGKFPTLLQTHIDKYGRRPSCVRVQPPTSASTGSAVEYQRFYSNLRNLGYRVLGNDCFIAPGSPLAKAQINRHLKLTFLGYNACNVSDVFGLGPSNRSTFANLRQRNADDLSEYLACEFGMYGIERPHEAIIKTVVDELLCYHQIDLIYFNDRYGVDLLPIIQQAVTSIDDALDLPLIQLSRKSLSLTPDGILFLAPLCQAVISQLSRTLYDSADL